MGRSVTAALGLLILAMACARSSESERDPVIAEVGSDRLSRSMARDAIPYAVWESDSVMALNRYVERWVTRKVLAAEAERLGLRQLKDVDERLQRMREDVLIEVLRDRALSGMADELTVTEDEIEAYFHQNRTLFELSERHVRVRHLATERLDAAIAAKRDLAAGLRWEQVVAQYAANRDQALNSGTELIPVSVALLDLPSMRPYLFNLPLNVSSGVREVGGQFHFIQIIESYPAGSTPDIVWVKDRIFEWLLIDKKRRALQQFERTLYHRAEAQGSLRITTPP